jgi:hypothetical protein
MTLKARIAALAVAVAAWLAVPGAGTSAFGAAVPPLPARLADTGLFVAGSTTEVRAGVVAFAPQYPLWSDGTTKRRWLYVPPGASIDASRADAWDFPRGTRLWKEFSFDRRVETRFIERLADGSWRFATYVWNEDGSDAVLAPAAGLRALPVASAPGGRYAVPSQGDCLACHEGAAVPVLGVSALQLSPDRDPLAPHADAVSPTDLRSLVARGWLRDLPHELLTTPPRIAAATPVERAALGYLHANCGHCHNDAADAAVPVSLRLAQRVAREAPANGAAAGAAATAPAAGDAPRAADDATLHVLASLLGGESRFQVAGQSAPVVTPGHAGRSLLAQRMRSRNPRVQMPPLGTQVPDAEGLALIERWINHELQARTHPQEPKS